MIANLIGGFVSILVGTSLIAPVSVQTNEVGCSTNLTKLTAGNCDSALYNVTSWGTTVLQLVPGFFALAILGIGLAVTYSALRQAGVV